MKILLIDQYGEVGGGQRCLIEAAAGFHARGWDLYAAIPVHGPLAANLAPFCRAAFDIPCGPFTPTRKTLADALVFSTQLPRQIASLRKIALQAGIDVLYVNGPRMLPAAALARLPLPLLFHTHWRVPQRQAARLVHWSARAGAVWIIGSSRWAAEAFESHVPPERRQVIYNGIAGFNTRPRSGSAVRRIGVLGRIAPEKGQLEFVHAARLAYAHNPDLRFTICGAPMFVGEHYLAQVQKAAQGLPIEFEGWTDDVGRWLKEFDLLVVPSDASDNVPRVILEAYAAGVAVVAFASGGIPELIQHGTTGWLVDHHTPEALAVALLEATRDPVQIDAIARAGHERWRTRYTLDRFQSELCEFVERAVRNHHRVPLATADSDPAA